MGRLFGTDGARGVAITELTCELAMQIGRAAAMVLTKETNHKAKIIIGKDTRISGDILESALVAGICSVGADAHILGVVPTPAVAMLVKKYNADAGVMISASHNSVEFNGIKLFSGTGFKLSDEIENEIEALILDTPEKIELKDGCDIGHVYYEKDAAWDYIRYVMKTVQTDFNGIRVALDCANGSASVCAQRIFEGLGAKCIMLNDKPDGTNINKDCGSTHIEGLQKAVVDNHCDIGLAFDGDADRCLAVDEKGELIDGDKILAIFSKYMKNMGILKNNTCVVTVMTNLGFFKYAKANGIVAATTKVGDRYVLEEMLKGGYNIGGEQSGHIILLDYANTGDGELTGTKLLPDYAAPAERRHPHLCYFLEHQCYHILPVDEDVLPHQHGNGHHCARCVPVRYGVWRQGRCRARCWCRRSGWRCADFDYHCCVRYHQPDLERLGSGVLR